MTGHIAFPGIKMAAGAPSPSAPASLSKWFLNDILRKKMGFNGLIITDDLMMNGATIWAGSLSNAAKLAMIAGNDILLFSSTPQLHDQVWTLLSNSMGTDEEFRERVREAARRTLELKLRYLRGCNAVPYIPDLQKVEAGIVDPEGSAFFLNLASRSVTFVKPEGDPFNGSPVFPITPQNAGRVLLAGQFTEFFRAGRAAFPGANSFWYSEAANIDELIDYASRADTIIFSLSSSEGVRVLRRLQPLRKRIIVLSVLSPVHIERVPWVNGAVAVYSYAPESFAAAFSAITGRIIAEGRLPHE
jgi:beta-N-acetylhexosaminidase